MILAGIQPSTVWFRVLQGMAAPACDQLCGGCLTLSLCPTAGWCVGPASRHRHRGKDTEVKGSLGRLSKALLLLALPFAGVAACWGSLGMGWAIAKLPGGTVGLEFSCNSTFWDDLQLQHQSQDVSIPEQFWGQGAARRGNFAEPGRLKAARPSDLPLACVTSMAASSQGQRQGTRCVASLAVP